MSEKRTSARTASIVSLNYGQHRWDADLPLRVALVHGDGIGPEVVEAAWPVLAEAASLAGVTVELSSLDWGGGYYLRHGMPIPDDAVDRIRAFDAVLFGSVGRPDIPDHVSIWGLILALRQGLDLYVNLRPVRTWAGIDVPIRNADGADFLIVRENTEGEYSGIGSRLRPGKDNEVAFDVAVHTRQGVARAAEFAFRQARSRHSRLTVATKSNVSKYGYVLWDETVRDVGGGFPDVECEFVLIDALLNRLVESPRSFDVILASNAFGDLLSNLAASLQGGLGMAPSANIHPGAGGPGIFEPIHGSAPDIAGRGVANPIACILSAALLLNDCGLPDAARAVEAAVMKVLSDGRCRPSDLGGSASTQQVAECIRAALPVAWDEVTPPARDVQMASPVEPGEGE